MRMCDHIKIFLLDQSTGFSEKEGRKGSKISTNIEQDSTNLAWLSHVLVLQAKFSAPAIEISHEYIASM